MVRPGGTTENVARKGAAFALAATLGTFTLTPHAYASSAIAGETSSAEPARSLAKEASAGDINRPSPSLQTAASANVKDADAKANESTEANTKANAAGIKDAGDQLSDTKVVNVEPVAPDSDTIDSASNDYDMDASVSDTFLNPNGTEVPVLSAEFSIAPYAAEYSYVTFYYGLDHSQDLFKSLYKGDAIEFPSPEKAMEGVNAREWAFAGWFTQASGGTMVADAKSNPVGGTLLATKNEVDYFAQYEYVGNYDITFNYTIAAGAGAGAVAPPAQVVKVKIGTAIGNSVPTPPEAPAGCKFGGWFDADGKAVDPRYVVVDGAMTFEGRYVDATVEMHAATFVWGMDGVGGGKQTIGPIDIEEGTAIAFPSASEVSIGSNYELVGWFAQPNGAGTKMAGGDSVAIAGTPAASFSADATFYAHYKYVGTYSVAFKYKLDDSAVAAAPSGTKAPAAKNYKLKAETFIGKSVPAASDIEGCVFAGWYVADAAGNPSGKALSTEQVAALTVDGPVTYIGVYTAAPKASHTVEFHWGRAYVGEGADASDKRSQNVSVQDGLTLAGAALVPTDEQAAVDGYRFLGWYDAAGKKMDLDAPVTCAQSFIAKYEKVAGPVDPNPPVGPVDPVEPDPPIGPVDPSPDPGPIGPEQPGPIPISPLPGGGGENEIVTSPAGNSSRLPIIPDTPWNPPGLALAARFTMPATGPGVSYREVVGPQLPDTLSGMGAQGSGDDANNLPSAFDGKSMDEGGFALTPVNLAVAAGLAGGAALAAFLVSKLAAFLAANASAVESVAAGLGAGGTGAAAAVGSAGGNLFGARRGRDDADNDVEA